MFVQLAATTALGRQALANYHHARGIVNSAKAKFLELARCGHEQAAEKLFRVGKVKNAMKSINKARQFTKAMGPAQKHNLAVMSYSAGEKNQALATFEQVKGRVPLAWCNLAVHYENAGIAKKSYEMFVECARKGVAFPELKKLLDSFSVSNCLFLNGSPGGSGIDMVGCHHGTFEGNRFEHMGANAVQAKGGTSDITIQRNFFKDGGQRSLNLGGSTGLQFFRPDTAHYEAADLRVYANIFVGLCFFKRLTNTDQFFFS